MKTILLITISLISISVFSQGGLTNWDRTYQLTTAEKVIQAELDYEKQVENDTAQAQYYVGMGKFRFLATYTGNSRKVDPQVLRSMKNVFKLKIGNPDRLDNLVSKEFEFKVNNSKVWMPIQNQLIDDLKAELTPGQEVLLYCLFINEHKFEGDLYNTFFISEFLSEWN